MARMNWGRVRAENRMERYGREGLDGRPYDGISLSEPAKPASKKPVPKKKSESSAAPNRCKPSQGTDWVICPDCDAKMKKPRIAKHKNVCPGPSLSKKKASQPQATPSGNEHLPTKPSTAPVNPQISKVELGRYMKTSSSGRLTVYGLPANKWVKITISYS